MSRTTEIPVVVTPEAAAFIAERGVQAEFQKMVEHARQVVSGLRLLQAEIVVDPDRDHPSVLLRARRDDPGPEDDPTERQWIRWEIEHFPPDVLRYFTFLSQYGAPNGR